MPSLHVVVVFTPLTGLRVIRLEDHNADSQRHPGLMGSN